MTLSVSPTSVYYHPLLVMLRLGWRVMLLQAQVACVGEERREGWNEGKGENSGDRRQSRSI